MAEVQSVSFSDLPSDPSVTPAEMRAHRQSYLRFERMILFAVLHIASILAAMALAFPGGAPVLGFLFGLVINLGLIVAAAVTGAGTGADATR